MSSISNRFVIIIAAIFTLAGCATSRSVLDIQPPTGQPGQTNGKSVFINPVSDNRSFQANPATPDIPSLDPSEAQSDSIKARAIGRKRNGFGKALGDMLLKDGETVQSLTYKSIQEAFVEKGYTVITNKDLIAKDTYIVNASIDKFWAWMNPGFWAITLSSEVSTDITVKSGKTTTPIKAAAKAADSYQVGTEKNWTEIIQQSLQLYVTDLKSKLN